MYSSRLPTYTFRTIIFVLFVTPFLNLFQYSLSYAYLLFFFVENVWGCMYLMYGYQEVDVSNVKDIKRLLYVHLFESL